MFSMVSPVPRQVSAAAPIRVIAQSQQNKFPASVSFSVRAEGDRPIVKATVYFKINDQATTSYAAAQITPGTKVDTTYTVDLRKSYVPPGVRIRYQWLLEDDSNATVRSDWTTFTLEDPRFTWKSVNAENVTVSWYQGDADFGEALRKAAGSAITTMSSQAGVKVEAPIRILIYANDQDFMSAEDPGTHEWAGGSAFPRYNVILIHAAASNLDYATRTIPHELTHVIIYNATKNPYGGIPHWLDEGLAMVSEGEQEPGFDVALKAAVKNDSLISVWSLSSNFPTDARQARLSYAQSYSLTRFVIDKYGQSAMSKLLAAFREGATYDDALKSAIGLDTYGLDDAWRAGFGLPPARSDPVLTPVVVATAEPRGVPTAASVPTERAQPTTTAAATAAPVAAVQATAVPAPTTTGSPTAGAAPAPTPTPSGSCALPALAIGVLGLAAGLIGKLGVL
jgi:hypothetical protein